MIKLNKKHIFILVEEQKSVTVIMAASGKKQNHNGIVQPLLTGKRETKI